MKRKSAYRLLAEAVRKKERRAHAYALFACFLRGRLFPLTLLLFSFGLLLFLLWRPVIKVTDLTGGTFYFKKSTYSRALQTISRGGRASLALEPSLTFEAELTRAFTFCCDTRKAAPLLLSLSGNTYGYREVYSIGGKTLCTVLPEECERAEAIIHKAMDDTLKLWSDADEARIEGDLERTEKLVSCNTTTDLSTLYDDLMTFEGGGIYLLNAGETGLTVADRLGLSRARLSALNPSKALEDYGEGDELTLSVKQNVFTVSASYTVSYSDIIPYETETKRTRTLVIGKSRVETEGVNGTARVTAVIHTENGYITSSEELSREELIQPQTEVLYVGYRVDDGKLFYAPVDSVKISSYFGKRTLRGKADYHKGVDYVVEEGTYVYAAAGGVVTKCGVFGNGDYGKCVVIDHGNGFVTYYAHNSKLLVSVGDRVVMGEAIALSGNTGNSTGPHCHFEVRKNGTAVNPFKYMTKP